MGMGGRRRCADRSCDWLVPAWQDYGAGGRMNAGSGRWPWASSRPRLRKSQGRTQMKRIWLLTTLLMLSLSATGCASREKVGIEFCRNTKPFVFTNKAEIKATPISVKRQALEHNRNYRDLCGGSVTNF